MKPINDPFLGEPADYLFTASDNRGHPGRFSYYRASNGMMFLHPVPADLAAHYKHGFQPVPADEAGLARAAQAEAFKIDQLRRYVKGGRYLEIGPWIGMAAYNARQAGFDVTTLEISRECVDLMRRSGLRAIQSDDPAAWLADAGETFDAIALWHSIEHVPHPWQLLDLAMRHLRPGGVILVATPNPDSAQARHHGARWFHLDAPRHLHLLPMAMVQQIGKRAGLELVERTTDDRLGLHLDRQGWEWPVARHIRKLGVGALWKAAALVGAASARRHRVGDDDGAAYTIVMRRPTATA